MFLVQSFSINLYQPVVKIDLKLSIKVMQISLGLIKDSVWNNLLKEMIVNE